MSIDRDKELDGVQSDLKRPYIEKPDEVATSEGALCFLDRHRVCGPDCASYTGDAPLPAERCTILSGVGTLVAAVYLYQKRQVAEAPTDPVTLRVFPDLGGKR